MNYRVLGRTGLKVSEIALGCEGFNGKSDADAKELFDLALGKGEATCILMRSEKNSALDV